MVRPDFPRAPCFFASVLHPPRVDLTISATAQQHTELSLACFHVNVFRARKDATVVYRGQQCTHRCSGRAALSAPYLRSSVLVHKVYEIRLSVLPSLLKLSSMA